MIILYVKKYYFMDKRKPFLEASLIRKENICARNYLITVYNTSKIL